MAGDFYVAGSERISLLMLLGTCMWCWTLSFFASYHLDVSEVVQTRLPHELRAPLAHSQLQKISKDFSVSLWARVGPLLALGVFLHPVAENFPLLSIVERSLPLLEFALIIWYLLKHSPILSYCASRLLLIEPKPKELRNVYILLSDSLTSFSKPLIDYSLYVTALLFDTDSHLDLAVAMVPVSIRMFQCAREYYLTSDRQHIWNFLKYSTNVPILVCVWYSRVQPDKFQYGTQLWFMLLNASYTFYWDVFVDWKLESVLRLREKRLGFPTLVYYVGIFVDFVIKYWWLWTLHSERSSLFFPSEMQYLEILRRAVWVLFKLEAEHMC